MKNGMLRPFAFSLFALAACSKTDPAPSATPSPSTVTAVVDAAPPVAAEITWSGSYKSGAGTIYVPDGGEWSGTKWRGDDSGDGLGDGTLVVSIDPKSGNVKGVVDGPIAATVYGAFAAGQLSATLAPKSTGDAFTGTLLGTVSGDKLDGTMHVSSALDAHIIRSITFSLAKK